MKFMNIGKIIQVAAFGATIALGVSGTAALADTFTVSYLAAGVQNPSAITPFYETFGPSFTGTTTFNGSSITGTYTGAYQIATHDQYGGAGGTGSYITTSNEGSYTLTLSAGVNYFGFWLSALDLGNQVQFYNGSNLLFTYTPADLIAALGACSASNAYCGNPNTGQNKAQQYAYLNFFDANGTFDKIVYTETIPSAGYESDNHAVANIQAPPPGTVLGAVPEPSSLVLLGTGILGIAGGLRRKINRKIA